MNCPNPKALQALLDETLSAEEQPTIQAHLDTCERCQKVLEHLAAGGATWDKTAENLTPQPERDDTALFNVVEKLQEAPTSAEAPAVPPDVDLSFLQPSQRPDALGRLDEYEILSVVGKGGFGIVLKAFEEELHRIVAIKVLAPEIASHGTARERFVREAKAAAAVTHENIVTIHRVKKDATIPYLVMQFIGGLTLSQKIDQAGLLSVKEILRIGVQIAEGLAAAHKQGVVHRDIKPANILLENGVERVKITDFGLARAADDASVTQSGTVAGTPMYMSPEQANGEAIDLRSDLFSLGSVLYVMCTGKAPFRANSTMAVMKRVCDETPRPIQESNPDIPVWLSDIVTKLHAKKPADRFQTAKEVAELLGQHLSDLQAGRAEGRKPPVDEATVTLTAPPVAHAPGSPKRKRSRWAVALPILAGVVVVAIGLVAYFDRFFRKDSDRSEQAEKAGVVPPSFVSVFGKAGWRPLSDGKDWSGWKDHGDKFETLESLPRNFHLRMEAALHNGGSGDCAIVFRAQPNDMLERNSRWFVHFSENAAGRVAFSAGFEPANPRISQDLNLTGNNPKCGEWFFVDIVAKDESTEVRINGSPVTTFKHPNDVPGAGVLRLTHNGYKAPIAFRNIEVKDLTPEVSPNVAGNAGRVRILKALGIAALAHHESTGKGPANAAALKPFLGGDEKAWQALNDNSLVFFFNVGLQKIMANGGMNTVLAFDTQTPASGGHVLMADGSVRYVTPAQFTELALVRPRAELTWMPLFNGKDLTGWDQEKSKKNWKVVNNVLTGSAGKKVVVLPTLRQDFANFLLRAEVRLRSDERGKGNAVLIFRGVYRVDLYETTAGSLALKEDMNWLHHRPSSFAKEGEWFVLEVAVNGPHLTTKVNGQPVADVTDASSGSGGIALEIDPKLGHTTVEFRKIEIKELPASQPVPRYDAPLRTTRLGWVVHENDYSKTGFQNGRYFVAVTPGGYRHVGTPIDSQSEFACEVVGRITGSPTSMWGLRLLDSPHKCSIDFRLNGQQELEVRIGDGKDKEFTQHGLSKNPAIKAGEEFNKLTVISRRGRFEVYVNGVQIGEPVPADHVKMPVAFVLSANSGDNKASRAEFERITIWPADALPLEPGPAPLINAKPPPPPVAEKGVLDYAEIHDAKATDFDAWIAQLKQTGFRPVNLSIQMRDNVPRYTAIALKEDQPEDWEFTRVVVDEKAASARKHIKGMSAKNYSAVAQALYLEEGKLMWAFLWVNRPARQLDRVAYEDTFREALKKAVNDKMRPISISAAMEDGRLVMAAIFVDLGSTLRKRSMQLPLPAFQAWFHKNKIDGWRLEQVFSYEKAGETLFSGVFIQDAGGPDWDVSWSLTPDEYDKELPARKNQGFRPHTVVGHKGDAGDQRITAIWIRFRKAPAP